VLGFSESEEITPEELLSQEYDVLIPDILCNAGGVTVSYLEWVQDEQHLFWEEKDIFNKLESLMNQAFNEVVRVSRVQKVPMRIAANMVGISRVAEAIRLRGFYP
jgi:glutamate dehydrogenase/leucine dehydrogenase